MNSRPICKPIRPEEGRIDDDTKKVLDGCVGELIERIVAADGSTKLASSQCPNLEPKCDAVFRRSSI